MTLVISTGQLVRHSTLTGLVSREASARPWFLCALGHFPSVKHGNFLNDLQIFLGSHLTFFGLVVFLLIMFHSGISQLCVCEKKVVLQEER